MAITFHCDKCGQSILIDEAGAGQLVDCPKCGTTLEVPYKAKPLDKAATPSAVTARLPETKKCPFCAETIKKDAIVCKHCGRELFAKSQPTPASPIVPQQTLSPIPSQTSREVETNVKRGAALGGWVCFVIGAAVMLLPISTWFIYAPLFLASFILSIVAMAQRRVVAGVVLLLANVIGAPIIWAIAVALGFVTWFNPLEYVQKHEINLEKQQKEHWIPLVVAREDIPARTKITSDMITLLALPERPDRPRRHSEAQGSRGACHVGAAQSQRADSFLRPFG